MQTNDTAAPAETQDALFEREMIPLMNRVKDLADQHKFSILMQAIVPATGKEGGTVHTWVCIEEGAQVSLKFDFIAKLMPMEDQNGGALAPLIAMMAQNGLPDSVEIALATPQDIEALTGEAPTVN